MSIKRFTQRNICAIGAYGKPGGMSGHEISLYRRY